MSFVQFLVFMIAPTAVTVYIFNLSRWLWKGGNRLAGVGGYIMTGLAGGGSAVYFFIKLLM